MRTSRGIYERGEGGGNQEGDDVLREGGGSGEGGFRGGAAYGRSYVASGGLDTQGERGLPWRRTH